MKQTFEVYNVKCGGCANTLIKSLKDEFGEVVVDLEVNPKKITLDLEENQLESLKLKLRSLGYPLTTDELSGFEKATTTAKSFVSCAIGKIDVAINK
ncbi:heavy-metal-associated domain-containing protein [Aliarcobacter cibarius]|uniref:Copper chaperone n=1 Tax=Aliarcobacter cibarius TaxID=255507 RepID=A0A7L5JPU2_9BACT|nr:heavy-metal-associated domain-containing protein [Aliarcobacter cibarius]QKJ27253.1 copper chaperone [Aliarcobacter cibarius]TLT01528.1 heavy-metal-associated domain-containing protein [Aliarcobacter cibarius]TLT02019.1 heavy-metal-associated domain-containing protein [Aliarcobacter cibarius]